MSAVLAMGGDVVVTSTDDAESVAEKIRSMCDVPAGFEEDSLFLET